jgi:hypothetical protein
LFPEGQPLIKFIIFIRRRVMCKKLLPSVLLLAFLILVPLNANAGFPCLGASLAGAYSGVVAGTDSGTAFSSFVFLTLFSNGTLDVLSIFGEPGVPWQQAKGPGTWSFFFTTDGFCIILATTPGEGSYIASFSDDANSIQLSTPNDPHVQAAGVLRRSGT